MTEDAFDEYDVEEEELDLEEEFDFAAADEDFEPDADEEFEEITSDEVDRVLETLEELIDSVESENIRAYLEGAMNNIFYLVYSDDDVDSDAEEGPAAEAA